jgi:hypothetical protein
MQAGVVLVLHGQAIRRHSRQETAGAAVSRPLLRPFTNSPQWRSSPTQKLRNDGTLLTILRQDMATFCGPSSR